MSEATAETAASATTTGAYSDIGEELYRRLTDPDWPWRRVGRCRWLQCERSLVKLLSWERTPGRPWYVAVWPGGRSGDDDRDVLTTADKDRIGPLVVALADRLPPSKAVEVEVSNRDRIRAALGLRPAGAA